MITIRPDDARGRGQYGWLDARYSFSFAQYWDPQHIGFRALRVINEDRIQPGAGFDEHGHADMEIITYVIDGALRHRDSTGVEATLRPGDVQVMTAGAGIRHSEFNASDRDELHLLQIWIEPARSALPPRHAERHFDLAAKDRLLTTIASPDGRDGSLEIGQDAILFASRLDRDESVRHTPAPGRHAWLQVVRGGVDSNDVSLLAGDGAEVSNETTLTIRASENAEFLLFDLA